MKEHERSDVASPERDREENYGGLQIRHVTRVLLATVHYIRYYRTGSAGSAVTPIAAGIAAPLHLFEYRLTARQWLPVPRFHCTRTVLAASFNKLRLTSPNFRLETPRSRFLGLALETRIVCPVDYSAVALMLASIPELDQ